MAVDVLFTNGVIAAKEKYLLKDKLVRMCEMDAGDAFRVLSESGFGGTEGASVYDYDKLVAGDELLIDAFVREYAPSYAEKAYLLAPRDFHNAKAFVKARYLGEDAEKMLAPYGIIPIEDFYSAFKNGDYSSLSGDVGKAVSEAISEAEEYLKGSKISGAEVGSIFDKAAYSFLSKVCKHNKTLKKLISAKADMTNILTYLRSENEKQAEKFYVDGGKLDKAKLATLFTLSDDSERVPEFYGYESFLKLCLSAKKNGLPLTEAEKVKDSYECDYLSLNKYELKAGQPFLYYVFRRRAENENVRIVFVCLLGGMQEKEIKARLRTI